MHKEPFYEKLGNHIEQQKTFDMRSDTEGYPTIHWIIARSLLGDYTEFERYQLLSGYVTNVKNNLTVGIAYLEEKGIMVYRSIPKGKKNIQFLTTDPEYKEAKALDFDRQTNRMLNNLKAYGGNVMLKHPDRLHLIGSDTKRLTNKLEQSI